MTQIPAARHTLAIVRFLASRSGPVPAATLSRSLGLPRSSTYQLIAVLMDEGFVVHYPEDRTYGLSSLVAELGTASLRSTRLARLATPLMEKLVASAPIPVVAHLAVLSGTDVVYAARVQGLRAPMTVSAIGVHLPAHLTATGRALLALLPKAQVRALYPDRSKLTLRTTIGPSSLAELDGVLLATRDRGWATELGEITSDYASVGAAAVDRNDYPSAAIGLTFRADSGDDGWADLGTATSETARALSARLSGR
jgi:DNA-binding IclR family transcriptional regulator